MNGDLRNVPRNAKGEVSGHAVVVRGRDLDGFVVAQGLSVDGQEMLVPDTARLTMEISDKEPATVTFTIYASSVTFDATGQ